MENIPFVFGILAKNFEFSDREFETNNDKLEINSLFFSQIEQSCSYRS